MTNTTVTQDALSAQIEAVLDVANLDRLAQRLGRPLTLDETRDAIEGAARTLEAARLVLRQPAPLSIELSPRPCA